MDVTYRTGDMSAYICVEKYLIQNGFKKVATELQQTYKPILVYDYLNKKARFPFLRTSKLSGKSYGDTSEESLLLKNWEKLVEKVPIFIPEKLVIDIQKTTNTSHCWIQKLLGACLSKGFVHQRCAFQFYHALIGLKMRKGSFSEEEKDRLLEFVKKQIRLSLFHD